MTNVTLQLALVGVLILLNAFLTGSEIALVSLREGQLQRLEQGGGRGRTVAAIARDPNRFLATIQIGITLAGFLASATAAVALAEPLVEPLSFLGSAARPTGIFLVTLMLSFLTLVLGELAPKRVALQRAEGWALLAARPLALLSKVMSPIVWVLARCTDLVVRLAGGDPAVQREEITSEELQEMVTSREAFTDEQRTIISGAFEIAERTVREILVPRRDVMALPQELDVSDAIDRLVEFGHSRAPVYRGDLDDVVGIVHLRDLARTGGSLVETARRAPVMPETVGVLGALKSLRDQRQQMAIVINEYGSVEGIISVEDLLEEIVGEIYDEFDRGLDPADIRGARREADGSIVVPGNFPMHDLPDLHVSLPEGDYSTIAGLVLNELGRIPDAGEAVDCDGWHLEVLSLRGHAIERIRLRPAAEQQPEPADA